jgi:type IV secretory pathway VirB2 component (pilin)
MVVSPLWVHEESGMQNWMHLSVGGGRRGSLVIMLALLSARAGATSTMTGGGLVAMPWETPIQTVAQSITGPVALAVAIMGLAVCGIVLVFGGEITEFAKRAIYVVMVIAFLISSVSLMNIFYNFTGSMI